MTIAGVVLCGGKSSRMGQDKAKLPWHGQDLLAHQMATLSACDLSVVHCSGPQGIVDEQPGLGPLAGIVSCLNQLSMHQAIIFVPVDMPLLSSELLDHLLAHKNNKQATHYEGHMFPLLIENSQAVREVLMQQLNAGQRSIYGCLKAMAVEVIPHEWPAQRFSNANTPDDWETINRHLI